MNNNSAGRSGLKNRPGAAGNLAFLQVLTNTRTLQQLHPAFSQEGLQGSALHPGAAPGPLTTRKGTPASLCFSNALSELFMLQALTEEVGAGSCYRSLLANLRGRLASSPATCCQPFLSQ